MSERYWVSGAQIGMMQQILSVDEGKDLRDNIRKILNEIADKQFMGNACCVCGKW